MPAIRPITSTRPAACGSRPTSAAPTRTGRLPDVVTMNRAHGTHYTLFPDPEIPHVLHGWGDDGQPAKIAQRIGDVYIRNVTTDIRRYFGDDSSGEMIRDGNSIFIFEVAGLCIGHLGHLHHQLDDSHFAAIGRLDIVMVPIDGTYTMSLDGISDDHAAAARLRGAADASLHDAARRIHAKDRPAIRDRRAERAHPEDFAGYAAGHADGDYSARAFDAALTVQQIRIQGVTSMVSTYAPTPKAGSMPIRAKTGSPSAQEEIIDPARPIVDPHHHLWDRGGQRYLIEEMAADIASGHNVIATVYVEARSMYRAKRPGSVAPGRRGRIRQRRRGDERQRRLRSRRDLRRHRRPRQSLLGEGAREVLEAEIAAGQGPLPRHPAFVRLGRGPRRRRHVCHAAERPAARSHLPQGFCVSCAAGPEFRRLAVSSADRRTRPISPAPFRTPESCSIIAAARSASAAMPTGARRFFRAGRPRSGKSRNAPMSS